MDDADLDLLLIGVYCTADDLLPERPVNARRTRRSSPARPPLRSPADARRSAQAPGAARGDDRVALRRLRLPQPRSSRRHPSARLDPGRVRPFARDDPPLAAGRDLRLRLPAQPLALVLGDAPSPRLRSWPPTGPSGRWRSPSYRGHLQAGRRSSATRATQAASSPPPSRGLAPPSFVQRARTRQNRARSWRPFASGSSRSSSPARTCSRSSATVPRTPRNLFARIAVRLLALAACISLNHQLGRPSRAIANYTA